MTHNPLIRAQSLDRTISNFVRKKSRRKYAAIKTEEKLLKEEGESKGNQWF